MHCQEVQYLLLQSELNQAADGVVSRFTGDAAPHVAEHVSQCVACSQLARKLRRLETAVRSLPAPPGLTDSRHRFEASLQVKNRKTALVAALPPYTARRRSVPRRSSLIWRIADSRLTAAALLMLVIGGGIWSYQARLRQVAESEEAIDKLVEWNLRLAKSESSDERHEFYAASAEALKQRTTRAPLDAGDRRQANALIQNGAFLADNADPLAEADRFSDVADIMINKMTTEASHSPEMLEHLSQNYLSVINQGIQKNLDRAEAAAVKTPKNEQQLQKIDQRYARMQSKIEALIQNSPPDSHQQLRKALDQQQQKQNQRKSKLPQDGSR